MHAAQFKQCNTLILPAWRGGGGGGGGGGESEAPKDICCIREVTLLLDIGVDFIRGMFYRIYV